jgi:hypothetical protein
MRQLWDELHPGPRPPIAHPIPPLTPTPIPETPSRSGWFGVPRAILHPASTILAALPLFAGIALICTGCQVLTYTGPNGEHFSRGAFGADIALSELAVETDTNGLRRVRLQGYQNNSSQILGVVTEAAVRAALQAPK